jgi:hypothetical protein
VIRLTAVGLLAFAIGFGVRDVLPGSAVVNPQAATASEAQLTLDAPALL